MQTYIKLIEQQLKELNLPQNPSELYEPIHYILSLGGKRLRPALSLLSCHLFTKNYQKALPVALTIEVFHNFTLVHDDIMDNAPIRRGKKTIHSKWDTNTAILSGDAMLIEAYRLLSDLPTNLLVNVFPLFNKCAIEVCEGQQYDMNFENIATVSESAYLEMIRLKTAVLLGFSMEAGALVGGADEKSAAALKNFAINIGIGFQLKDDLLDVFGSKEKVGKQTGGDIIANKKTFLLIKALEKAKGETLQKLNFWLGEKEFDSEEKVKAVVSIYNELGIEQLTEKKMNTYFDKAFEILENIKIENDRKDLLHNFAKSLVAREY